MKAAELAARKELQAIVRQYRKTGWEEAVGSSGTAKALADILELNGLSGGEAASPATGWSACAASCCMPAMWGN